MERHIHKTLIFSLTALIFFFGANVLPFMRMEMYGRSNDATIWSGVVSLADSGSWFLALVVFVASLLIPAFKIFSLFYLALSYQKNSRLEQFRRRLFLFIEAISPWSMLDVFLLAVFVAIVKLDSLATVKAGPGAVFFVLVVIFTMLATKSYEKFDEVSGHD